MAVCDLVVIGSYPPMPGPATAATLGAVRRGWAEGAQVAMVSYRPGAAPLSVPVAGPLAGWRLEQVRRHFGGPSRVSLGVQKAVPFTDRRLWAGWVTAAGLAYTMKKFAESVVVLGEDPEIGPLSMAFLAWGATYISVPDQQLADRLARRYLVPARSVRVQPVKPFPDGTPGRQPGADQRFAGIYGPGAADRLVYVELPKEPASERVKARLSRFSSHRALRTLTGLLRR